MEKVTDIKSMTLDELKAYMTEIGEKPFRAKQIYEWIHVHLVTSYDEMTNVSKALREKLKECAPLTTLARQFLCRIITAILCVFPLR